MKKKWQISNWSQKSFQQRQWSYFRLKNSLSGAWVTTQQFYSCSSVLNVIKLTSIKSNLCAYPKRHTPRVTGWCWDDHCTLYGSVIRYLWALHWEVTIPQTDSLTLGAWRSSCSNYIWSTDTLLRRHCNVVSIVWPLLIPQWLVLNFLTFLSSSMFLIYKKRKTSTHYGFHNEWQDWVFFFSFKFYFIWFCGYGGGGCKGRG